MEDNTKSDAPSPEEEAAAQLADLRSRWESLAKDAKLNDKLDSIADTTADVSSLADDITAVRRRGYVFHKEWESKATALKQEWPGVEEKARRLTNSQARRLTGLARQAEQMVKQATGRASMLSTLDGQLDALAQQIEAAAKEIDAQVAPTNAQISNIHWGLEKADYVLDVMESGVVKVFPNEFGVAACPANMILGRKEKDEGVLLLTDKRLIFIHEEERVLKKVLFIVTEKETIRALRWAAPIGAVDRLDAEDKGGFLGFGEKEMLTIDFDDKAKDLPRKAVMHLTEGTENEAWRALIMRVKNGDIEKGRYTPPGQVESKTPAAPTKPIPTECPNCGAKLPPVYKGMTRIECDFCDAVVALG